MVAALLGCGGGETDKGVIGYTSKDLSNPFFNIIGDNIKIN